MKKIFAVALMLLVMGSASLKAQVSPKFELELSYGALNVSEFVFVVGEILGTAVTGGIEQFEDLNCSGAIGAEAYFRVANRLSIGGLITAESFKAKQVITIQGKKEYSDYQAMTMSLMPMFKVRYFNNPHVGMYGKAGAGVFCLANLDDNGKVNDNDPAASFMFNITPIGVDFGGERVRGFYELNLGTKGMLNFGVRFAL